MLHCLWNGETGGAERAVYQLVREQLRDPELAPAILFAQSRGPYWDAARELGCPVVEPHLPHGRAIWTTGRTARAMRGFNIHHFHSPEPLLMLASMRCRGAKRLYTRRGGTADLSARRRLRYLLIGEVLRRGFDGFSGNTEHSARTAARLFRIPEQRFAVVYNGLDFNLLEPQRGPREVREELDLDAAGFVLGTVAALRALKRIERLVQAMAAIGDPRMRLLIVGDGPQRGRLESMAEQLGVRDRTIFAGSRSHVADYLQVMDAFSLPSSSRESFGNAAVEAMALGVPTIVFADGGGLVEHVASGETGFVVEDQAELESAIRRLRDHPELLRRVGEAGRASVRSRYTHQQAAAGYRSLYEAVMRANPSSDGRPGSAN